MTLPVFSAARRQPHRLAFTDGTVSLTYAELESALATAPVTQLQQLEPGRHIAWCPVNDVTALIDFWAMQACGWVACPISSRIPASQRDQVVRQIDAQWLSELVTQDSILTVRRQHAEGSVNLNRPATIILSSGSTGTPKAVVHSLAAHIASAQGAATNMPLKPGDRWLWSLPLYHVSGLSILVRCAVAAATVVGMPAGAKLDAALLDEQQVTHLSVVSTQLRRLLAEPNFPSPHLKWVLLGGSSVDPKLVASARQRGVHVLTTYGLTEMASQVTTSTRDEDPASSGHILPGRELKLSSSGEIWVRGETLCLGYFREGRIHPVVDEEGWFHTKDLGVLDSSQSLTVSGRLDNMFISGGENIHPENIERAMRAAFDIEQVIVVPAPDNEFSARPVAFVLGDLPANWQTELRSVLNGCEVPVEVFVWPDGFNDTVKVDRKRLESLASKLA